MHKPGRFGGASAPSTNDLSVYRNRQERLYSRSELRGAPIFSDIPDAEEKKTLAGESDPNVLRSLMYRDFAIKMWRPYNHWKVFCRADMTKAPDELSGNYTDLKAIKAAIDQYLIKGEASNESSTD